jgi:hypothetical protein
MENQIIPLSNEDIASQTDQTLQSKKGKVDKTDRKCPQPSQEEIDVGFVFGRNFIFHVSMEKVRPPTLETTNQRILSEENARTVYSKLRSGEISSSTLLTLRPVSYTSPIDSEQNETREVAFKKRVSKTTFLGTLNSMEGNNMEKKRDALLPNVTWEPVDGQHIQYACNVLAREDFLAGKLSKTEYEAIFIKRPAPVVFYNDEICYGVQSLKLNDYNIDRVYHGSLIERLAKARNQWFEDGCPFRKDTALEGQVEFLRSLPSSLKVIPPFGKDSVKEMKEFYKNYLHPVMLDAEPWEAFKKMCEAYEKGWTYYAPGSKKDQLEKGKRQETFSIGWLKPLQATCNTDFMFFCQKATVSGPEEVQELYFKGHLRGRADLTTNTLACMAYKAKSRVSIQNAFRWLHVSGHASSGKSGWLTQNVVEYGDKDVLDELSKEGTQMFHKKWAFIPSNTGFDTMRSSSYLLPQLVVNQFNNIKNGGVGLFQNGKLVHGDSGGNWSFEFQHVGAMGNGFDTMVKVAKSMFDVDDGLKIAKRTCWIFECRGYGRSSTWGELEYSNIWQKIDQSMGDVDHWNVLLFLPAGADVVKITELLQLLQETTDILNLSYVFAPQCKEKGQEVRGSGTVLARVKPVGSIIIVLRHPASSTSRLNLTNANGTIDPVYTEPDSWDVCTSFKEARNPQCIDNIMRPFYNNESWTIAVQGYTHMSDTLTSKTQELIIMESDPSMMSWLQEWKRQTVDMEPENKFELWEDEKEASKDVH